MKNFTPVYPRWHDKDATGATGAGAISVNRQPVIAFIKYTGGLGHDRLTGLHDL